MLATPVNSVVSDMIPDKVTRILSSQLTAMATEEEGVLASQPWKPFTINNEAFLVKSHFSEETLSYELNVCDLKSVWSERVDREQFEKRCKELNKNVEAELSFLFDHVIKMTDCQRGDANYTVQEEENCLRLRIKSCLSGDIPFTWEFYCQKADPQQLKEHLVEPLLIMVGELYRRQREMEAIIKKKDKQIEDYKDSGAKLTRRSLGTKTYQSDNFHKEMMHSQNFDKVVGNAVQNTFSEPVQDLYSQVMTKKALMRVKQQAGADSEDAAAHLTEYPPRLGSGYIPSPQSSPLSTPTSSPMKPVLSSPTKSPEKDEKTRQEQLRKRLMEESEKKEKKKKRKINL